MFLFQVDREINEDKQDRQSDRVREIAIIVVVEMLKKIHSRLIKFTV